MAKGWRRGVLDEEDEIYERLNASGTEDVTWSWMQLDSEAEAAEAAARAYRTAGFEPSQAVVSFAAVPSGSRRMHSDERFSARQL